MRAVLLMLCVVLSGCAIFAGRSDYLDYRDVRLSNEGDARLLAMQRYVARHPDGHWYGEIQQQRSQQDRVLFEQGKSTRAGLELYLSAFPDGAFVGQAKSRLAAVAVIEQRKRDEAARADQLAQARKAHDVEQSRTWVSRFFGYWVKTLSGLQGWGSPIEQVARGNAEFSRAFARPPRPRCTADECVKYYESSYAVPIPGGTRIERTMRLILRLRMDQGRVVRAELLLPTWGFSRWKELEERSAVVDADPEARKQAVDWALARASALIDAAAPGRQEVSGYTLAEIPAPAISPTGELVDTTAEDPSAPQNTIQSSAAPSAEPGVEEMLKPQAPEQAPDLEMAPLRVGPDGRALPAAPAAPAPNAAAAAPGAEGAGDVMEMAPLAVPPAAGTPATGTPAAGAQPNATQSAAAPQAVPAAPSAAPAAAAPTSQALAVAPAVTHAFRIRDDLRLVVFAAASDAKAPAYDGIVIERADIPGAHAGRSAKPKRVAPLVTPVAPTTKKPVAPTTPPAAPRATPATPAPTH